MGDASLCIGHLHYILTMDKQFRNPFNRPYENGMAASTQPQESTGIGKYLPKSKAFKGIIAGWSEFIMFVELSNWYNKHRAMDNIFSEFLRSMCSIAVLCWNVSVTAAARQIDLFVQGHLPTSCSAVVSICAVQTCDCQWDCSDSLTVISTACHWSAWPI